MLPKKIYLNYVDESDEDKTLSDEPISLYGCNMQNREYTDLSLLWHDTNEEPRLNQLFLAQIGDNAFDTFVMEMDKNEDWKEWSNGINIKRWAYISDLLPKGGEK